MQKDSQALVSVIVPIYNVETYLDQCLSSICCQTYRRLEIICVNDGSTDGSLAIIQQYADKDSRIRVINKENGGYGEGCNRGIAEAHGEWISIIEPDDWIEPSMYEDMLGFAASFDVTIDIVKTPWIDIQNWDDPSKQAPSSCALAGRLKTSARPFKLKDAPVLIEEHPSIWSAIYRKDFLDERGIRFIPYPGAGWADNPFLIETFCQAHAIIYLDQAYYNYRCDLPGSTYNHQTDEAIARPFDRWIDMFHIMKRLNITDRGILEAHYLRGFRYIHGAIVDDGWDTPLVRVKTREVFEMMDAEIVRRHPKINKRRKRMYFEVLGKPCPRFPILPRAAYLARESLHSLHTHGLIGFLSHVFRFTMPEDEAQPL